MPVRRSFVPRRLRRSVVPLTVGALAASGLALGLGQPAQANPAGTGLVISEVYGAGGNPGATFNADFVELFNPTAADISLAGLSVQFRAAAETAVVEPLSGTVPAGAHFLVQMSPAGAVGLALPEPDLIADPGMAMNGPSGQVFLATTTTAVAATGNVAGSADLWDMVGYGSAGTFETANTGVALNSSTAAARDALGTDTDHNANDFTEGTPDPQNDGRATTTVSGTADPLVFGQAGSVVVSVAPSDAPGTVEVYSGDTLVGSGTLDAGSATVALAADALEPGSQQLRLEYLGGVAHAPDTGSVDVEVAKASATVTADAAPTTLRVNKDTTTVTVGVTATGVEPTGVVEASVDGSVVASGSLTAGSVSLEVGPFTRAGSKDIELTYLGDTHVASATQTATVTAVKSAPKLAVKLTPSTAKRGVTRVLVTSSVSGLGLKGTGTVTVKLDGRTVRTKTLVDGTAKVRLKVINKLGAHQVKVVYSGDATFTKTSVTKTLRVTR